MTFDIPGSYAEKQVGFMVLLYNTIYSRDPEEDL